MRSKASKTLYKYKLRLNRQQHLSISQAATRLMVLGALACSLNSSFSYESSQTNVQKLFKSPGLLLCQSGAAAAPRRGLPGALAGTRAAREPRGTRPASRP